jgi:hypothetical protein
VNSLAFVHLGKHVESILKVMALAVDFVTSSELNHISDGQMRGHKILQEECAYGEKNLPNHR